MSKLSTSLFLPVFLLMAVSQVRAQTIQLTNGGSTEVSQSTAAVPVSSYFEYMRFQVVYTAAELNAAGITGPKTISQLGWYIVTAPANALPNYTISLGHTTAANSASHNASTLTEVYSSASYAPVAGGFDMLTLGSGFVWNGTDNILVDVCYGAAAYLHLMGRSVPMLLLQRTVLAAFAAMPVVHNVRIPTILRIPSSRRLR
ncbi:MAG: hypothetical protein IPL27_20085 [Lewinellaceae bacterium]|nr:hypothetical protein [Lewinellaceae bacterium]